MNIGANHRLALFLNTNNELVSKPTRTRCKYVLEMELQIK